MHKPSPDLTTTLKTIARDLDVPTPLPARPFPRRSSPQFLQLAVHPWPLRRSAALKLGASRCQGFKATCQIGNLDRFSEEVGSGLKLLPERGLHVHHNS
ncbi:hypothetical protein G7K_6744-t1 [Saitoella complicata NRRL Y-17804]|uniref:Uncharacterized protein n=1 Tax=Saitoella complicata (strain BCRC 22490 / CBS 7301 / JCM 7358 / NBRC 10748 / NRRL Y-17804) TaxID=698492 RepID=A0A0E9NS15_SAICN|nr:hypothetical protein G7K_6744-t1 [Saitoella complicata NRRL Y-17804]